jgi:hypothetical protein
VKPLGTSSASSAAASSSSVSVVVSNSSGAALTLEGILSGRNVQVLVDTGSSVSLIERKLALDLSLALSPVTSEVLLKGLGASTPVCVRDCTSAVISVSEVKAVPWTFFVTDFLPNTASSVLLGMDYLTRVPTVLDFAAGKLVPISDQDKSASREISEAIDESPLPPAFDPSTTTSVVDKIAPVVNELQLDQEQESRLLNFA